MKVSELIELLEEQDPDAEVLVMSQENWPFECAIAGVATRDEILRADADERDEDDERDDCLEPGAHRNDVFIVEGEQLRYGSKTAWNVATR
ncbi:MAG: hypothetical protein ACOX6T_23870 [Myxococcales bacterium]|jgi:hypothetical protein